MAHLRYENMEVGGVRVLRRDPTSARHWICKCPLCHDEYRVRTDALTNGTLRPNCGKHSKAYHARAVRKAERDRIYQGLKTEPSAPEDDAEYGVVQEIDERGNLVKRELTREERAAKRRKKQDDEFRKQVFPNSMLRAVERLPDRSGQQYWMFRCACGGKVAALRGNVVSGRTRSCGCISRGRPKGALGKKVGGETPAIKSPKAFLDLWK